MADPGKTAPARVAVVATESSPVAAPADFSTAPLAAPRWFENSAYCQAKSPSSPRDQAAQNLTITFLTAYGRMGTPTNVDEILAVLHDDNPCVRGAALWALGEIGPQTLTRSDIPADRLLASLRAMQANDADAKVREEAARTLIRIAGP